MDRTQLNIKLDSEEDKQLLADVKARAASDRISLKECVLKALKAYLASPPTQSAPTKPYATKHELEEVKRRMLEIPIGLMGEVRKNNKEITGQIGVLAQAIAEIESRLDNLDPPDTF